MLASLVALLLGMATSDSTPPRPITELVHTRWTLKDGAPIGVRSLAQTADGYLWLGTGAGVVRFDGVRFVTLAPRGTDTLPVVQSVLRLVATRDSSLWIVWRLGAVTRLKRGRLTTWGERDGLASAFELAESSDGMLIAGTIKGLARFANGTWQDVTRAWNYPGTESRAVWFDRDGALWAQTQDRIVYRPKGAIGFLDPQLRLARFPFKADFAQAADGTIWMSEVARSAHTLRRLGEDSVPLTEVQVYAAALLLDRKGSLWVASTGVGLRRVVDPARIRGRKVGTLSREAEHFTMKEGLLSDDPEALLEDREGNIWVGSGRGLERFREGDFTPHAVMGRDRSRIVFAARDTTLWTAAYQVSGVVRLDPRGRQDTIATQMGKDVFGVFYLAEDSSGAVWTVNRNDLLRLEGRRWVRMPLRHNDASALSNLAIDARGTFWALDDSKGLLRLSHDSLLLVARFEEPLIRRGALYPDRQGRVWVGQLSRVTLYDHGNVTMFGVEQGVRSGLVYDFAEDRDGQVWAASVGGLSRFEGGRFRTIAERQGIPRASVFGLTQDETGAWWLATRTGVLRLPPGEAERALADSTYVVRSRTFDTNDGIPGLVPQGYWGTILTRAVDGRIWVAADSGVGGLDPRRLTIAPPPPAMIEGVRIDGRESMIADVVAIPPGRHDLEIDYTTISLTAPDRVRFRYRLDGVDEAWRDAGTSRRAYYSGLAPGDYRFRVAATTGDDVWNETGTTWRFRVQPAWYQTLPFRAGAILLIGALGAAAAALVQRRRHLRAQAALRTEYETTLAERARIAQDLHDTLLQGFAGVTLQLKGAALALPERPEVAAETIARVQRLAHESLREARERVWDMHESHRGAADLTTALESSARDRTAGTGIEVAVVTAGVRRRLASALEDTALRIGREAIANAVRHAQPQRIDIAVDYGATSLRVEVRDDGRGFSTEQGEEARRTGHFGLTGIRDRATRAGGRCEVLARPGEGTVVAVELPVSEYHPY